MASRTLIPFSTGRLWGGLDPMLELHREMNRLFDDALRVGGADAALPAIASMAPPRLDVQESDGELRLKADVPGVQPGELDVRLEGDVLTLSGERRSENDQSQRNYRVQERSYGRFQRSVQLPFTPDPQQVQADFEHGVLTIRIPRPAQQERSRRIEVRTPDAGSASQGASPAGGQPTAEATQASDDDQSSTLGGTQPPPAGQDGRGDGAGASH